MGMVGVVVGTVEVVGMVEEAGMVEEVGTAIGMAAGMAVIIGVITDTTIMDTIRDIITDIITLTIKIGDIIPIIRPMDMQIATMSLGYGSQVIINEMVFGSGDIMLGVNEHLAKARDTQGKGAIFPLYCVISR